MKGREPFDSEAYSVHGKMNMVCEEAKNGYTPLLPSQTSVLRRLKLRSNAVLRRRFMVTDESVMANIRVGLLLEILDKLAEQTALRYVRRAYPAAHVVTAALDDLKVHSAPDLGQDIVLRSRVNFVGKTSLEVGIRLEQPGDKSVHFASCYFTMVARAPDNSDGFTLPALRLESAVDRKRFAQAELRRRERRFIAENVAPTAEEWALLRMLHDQQQLAPSQRIPLSELQVSCWERTYPENENVPLTVFGGYILHRAYVCAHLCAEMVADRRALLVAATRLNFHHPVRMGDKLHFESRVSYTGSTSVSVETMITCVSRDRNRTQLSNTCIFTFVNVDEHLQPCRVLAAGPGNFGEDARWLEGAKRRQAHIATKSQSRKIDSREETYA